MNKLLAIYRKDRHISRLDIGLDIFVAGPEIIGSIRSIGLGCPQHRRLDEIIPNRHHPHLPVLRLGGRLLPALIAAALGGIPTALGRIRRLRLRGQSGTAVIDGLECTARQKQCSTKQRRQLPLLYSH